MRVLSYVNHAHMGDYRQSVQQYLSGKIATPDITQTERSAQSSTALASTPSRKSPTACASSRASAGTRTSTNHSSIPRSARRSFRRRLQRPRLARPNDKVGVAYVSNAIKRDHQNYLHYGGLGFLLGDGNLSYGREDIVEWYYNAHLWRGFYSAVGGAYIDHPGL